MKKYLSFFRIKFIGGLQYRAAALAGIVTQFAWGFMSILMYKAFYESNPGSFPMEFSQLTTYIWLQQALLAMFMPWLFESDIFNSVTSGNVAYELCRPCDTYNMWFARNAALRLSNTALRCLPIILVAVFLPDPFRLTLPAGWLNAVLFLVSIILGFLVQVSITMIIYVSVFYTLSASGIKMISVTVTEFLSGAVIPIPFFPEAVQKVFNALPFASIQNTPFLIYVGYTGGAEAAVSIAIQAAWLVVIFAVGRLMINHAMKRIVVQGG